MGCNEIIARSGYSWLSGVNPSEKEGRGDEELDAGGEGEKEEEEVAPEGQDSQCIVCFSRVSPESTLRYFISKNLRSANYSILTY